MTDVSDALPPRRPAATPDLRAWEIAGLVATLLIILSVPLFMLVQKSRGPRVHVRPEALYVGSERCGTCHKKEMDTWRVSNHGRAMAAAREGNVLGDFNGTAFEQDGKQTRFSRQGDKYFVHTEGADGKPTEFEIPYTFGWFPLQQYLVPFPGGRLQCLTVAWDVPGKKWYSLYPKQQIRPGEWLHWTKPAMNWNTMCADCHSTAVRKRYDPQADTFRTTWSEITVGCEACHGPGSLHEAWAQKPAMARSRVKNAALLVKTSGMTQRELVNLCAPCHSRRAQIKDADLPGGEPLDSYLPTLLTEGLYYPDGQILDEDYEYQSFLQSKMFEKGVKCNDCHDVHRAKRHTEGNLLCLKCHRADTYDTDRHHFHKKEVKGRPSEGASCPSCHMPGRTYMGVHFRRDHSIRVPRPDLSREIGTPNACSECHKERTLTWVTDAYTKWYGKKQKPHYGTVIAAARQGKPGIRPELLALAADRLRPAIVRATALDLLGSYPGDDSLRVLEQSLSDEEAMIRRAAASRLSFRDPRRLVKALAPLTRDPVLGVRLEAAARLVGVPQDLLTPSQAKDFRAALEEYQTFMAFAADMPSGRFNWGNLWQALGNRTEAEKQYRQALVMDDRFDPARVNLALLLAGSGQNAEAVRLLSEVVKASPRNAPAALDLGLLLAEEKRPREAEAALRLAWKADPQMAPAAYNLAVLIFRSRPAEALELSLRAAALSPDEPRYAMTAAFYQLQTGDVAGAQETLEALVARFPAHGEAVLLLGNLYQQRRLPGKAAELYRKALATEGLSEADRQRITARQATLSP